MPIFTKKPIPPEADGASTENAPPKEKKSVFARFRAFLFEKQVEAEEPREMTKNANTPVSDTSTDDLKKFNAFLGTIENQLGRVDEQNKSLLEQLSVLKSNNETLVTQVKILTNNNNQLTEQFNASKKREKIAKTLAIISAIAAIGLTTYNFLMIIF